MSDIEIIPIAERLCDMCNDIVTDEFRTALKAFLLTDWGVICRDCWDNRIKHPEEFRIIRVYQESETVRDGWVDRPMVMEFGDDLWP